MTVDLAEDLPFLHLDATSSRRPARCGCGQRLVGARTTAGDDVLLDAGADGDPAIVAGGRYVQIATASDAVGRRAILVEAVAEGGQHRAHAECCAGGAP